MGKVTAVLGMQWGDEGKGKIVDALMRTGEYAVSVRMNGGGNAGHSVVLPDGKKSAVHLLPSGAFTPGTTAALGRAMVVDLRALVKEIASVREANPNLEVWVDPAVQVVLPYHRVLDADSETRSGTPIGTTRQGNGPAYAHKALRIGLSLADLLYDPVGAQKVVVGIRDWTSSMFHGIEPLPLALDVWHEQVEAARELVKVAVILDVGEALTAAIDRGHGVLFSAAHGVLLDIDHGTYPFVTSSTCGIGAVATTGFDVRRVRDVLGVAKCYMTRVGAGPFPTEMPTETGSLVREAGHEYGTTTGRPRRVGWLDVDLLRYAARVNGVDRLALTLVDVLAVLPRWWYSSGMDGELRPAARYAECKPDYAALGKAPGSMEDIQACTSFAELPEIVHKLVLAIERKTRLKVELISNGPGADRLIRRENG